MGYINLKIQYKGEKEARQITDDLNETQLNSLMGYVNGGCLKGKTEKIIITEKR